jgi:hypothetical protein
MTKAHDPRINVTHTRHIHWGIVITKTTLGASLALGLLLSPHSHGTVHAAPLDQNCAPTVVYCPRLDEPADPTIPDPFDQRSFPCEEDEVLGYAPQFGPDRVGCIHIDELA